MSITSWDFSWVNNKDNEDEDKDETTMMTTQHDSKDLPTTVTMMTRGLMTKTQQSTRTTTATNVDNQMADDNAMAVSITEGLGLCTTTIVPSTVQYNRPYLVYTGSSISTNGQYSTSSTVLSTLIIICLEGTSIYYGLLLVTTPYTWILC